MTTSLFQRLLGGAFARLPAPVRRLHDPRHSVETAGRADVTVAPGLLPWLLCRLAGLPRPGSDVPVAVSFHPDRDGRETWRRQFMTRRYTSTMRAGAGAHSGLLLERLWPCTYYHRLTPTPTGVAWRVVKWRLFGVPLPRASTPFIDCFESADGDRYRFDIRVVFPYIGPVIHYRGWLLPADETGEE